jgi:hypothetical protein
MISFYAAGCKALWNLYIEKFILSGEFIMNDWFNYE